MDFKGLIFGVLIALGVCIAGRLSGLAPIGGEPFEEPWRILLFAIPGFVVGSSAGLSWFHGRNDEPVFNWKVWELALSAIGLFWFELGYASENELESVYTFPALVTGTVAGGVLIGALVRTQR